MANVRLFWVFVISVGAIPAGLLSLAVPSYAALNRTGIGNQMFDMFHKNRDLSKTVIYVYGLTSSILILVNFLSLVVTAKLILNHSINSRRLRRVGTAHRRRRNNTGVADGFMGSVPLKELNLTAYAMLLSGAMFLFVIYAVLNSATYTAGSSFNRSFKGLIFHLSTDIVSVINPFGLILLSSSVRQQMARYFLTGKCSEDVKILKFCSNLLLILPVVYGAFLVFTFLGMYDIFSSCAHLNVGYFGFSRVQMLNVTYYHYQVCQIAMQCI